ncbi:MAG: hypothetical protein FWD83_05135 [Promicromonosporaceae bacterium]|nr:hypothetical protein [Promicromonosporaceae bacterium]
MKNIKRKSFTLGLVVALFAGGIATAAPASASSQVLQLGARSCATMTTVRITSATVGSRTHRATNAAGNYVSLFIPSSSTAFVRHTSNTTRGAVTASSITFGGGAIVGSLSCQ